MTKKIHTIQSSDKVEFDKQINFYLEYGGELVDGGYEVINNDDGVVYSQVVLFKDCIVEFHDNGNMKRHVPLNHKGQLYEVETCWYKSKRVKSYIHYKNDLENEDYEIFYENGEEKLEGYYKKGKRHGLFHGSYESGDKEFQIMFKNGLREGIHEHWYRNGNIKSSHRHKNDKIHGNYSKWYENGQMKEQGVYKRGEKIGKWEYWNEDGSVKK